jgi:DNA-binding transcriptional LysR family regulator
VDLRQLAAFVTVAEQSSFTRAAAILGYAQSSVTAQVKGLEDELGVPLFERLGKRVSLTRAGQRLMPHAQQMLRLAEEIRRTVPEGELPSGPLAIGAPETLCTYLLPDLLARYRARHPQVQLLLHPGSCGSIRSGIRENQLDVGLLLDDLVDVPGLTTEVLRPEPVTLVAPPGHPLTRLRQVLPLDLAGENMLYTEPGSYRSIFEQILAGEQVRLASVQEFGSIEAIKRCVTAGLGLAVIPRVTIERELARGELRALPWGGPPIRVYTQLVYHKDKWPSPAMKAFVDLIRHALGSGTRGIQAQLDLLPAVDGD